MKNTYYWLLPFLLLSCSSAKKSSKMIFKDEKGITISSNEFDTKWRNQVFSRWDYIDKYENRVAELIPKYDILTLDYGKFKNLLESLTSKQITEDKTILIEFTYLDDLCSSSSTNNWKKEDISRRKRFMEPAIKTIKENYPEVAYFHFFEKGILLENNPKNEEESYYSDSQNLIREIFFKNSAFCGSYALVKPNGECLVYNGESRADFFVQHLKPENWSLFFDQNKQKTMN